MFVGLNTLPYEVYTGSSDRQALFSEIISQLPTNSVIITSRSMISRMNISGQPKAATVYRYEPKTKEIIEVFAASDDIGEGDQEV